MDEILMPGVLLTPLSVIPLDEGDILHAMKKGEAGFCGFGEAYFSTVREGHIKAWKRHRQMTLNLVVPLGTIRFVLYDDRPDSPAGGQFFTKDLSVDNYCRLTVPPMVWFGFQGLDKGLNLLLNLADIVHDAREVDRLGIGDIGWAWATKKQEKE